MERPEIRLVHWYDVDAHRNACGADGQTHSTKHVRAVTCSACRSLATELRPGVAAEPVAPLVH